MFKRNIFTLMTINESSTGKCRETVWSIPQTRATNFVSDSRIYFLQSDRFAAFAPRTQKKKIHSMDFSSNSNDVYDQQNCPQSGSPHDRRPQIGSVSRLFQIGVSKLRCIRQAPPIGM